MFIKPFSDVLYKYVMELAQAGERIVKYSASLIVKQESIKQQRINGNL